VRVFKFVGTRNERVLTCKVILAYPNGNKTTCSFLYSLYCRRCRTGIVCC